MSRSDAAAFPAATMSKKTASGASITDFETLERPDWARCFNVSDERPLRPYPRPDESWKGVVI